MKKLSIIIYPNPILLKKTKKIKNHLAPEIQKLIPQMIEVMKKSNGMGLAANQVGKFLRLCIIKEKEQNKIYILINPTITAFSRKKVVLQEGCLSFPQQFFSISRSEKIKVRFLDEQGEKVKIKAEGLLARAIQHEVDHLDGIVFIERLKK